MPACHSPLDFAFMLRFSPNWLPAQSKEPNDYYLKSALSERSNYDSSGWGLIALGCFKKVVIADNLARYVDAVYAIRRESMACLWIATYAFAIQIYCDFSGYSDIAVGLARVLGIQLIQNSMRPTLQQDHRVLEARHISLSTWLRTIYTLGSVAIGKETGTRGAT